MTWDGSIIGTGSQLIVESRPFEHVETVINPGAAGESGSWFDIVGSDGGTNVVWTFETDYGFNLVGRYIAILIDDIIGGYKGLPEPLQKKKWIELKLEEATDKLANFIAINPEEVVMPKEAERLIKEVEALRPRVKVHAFPYYHVGKIGGSLRCNTCPIYREG